MGYPTSYRRNSQKHNRPSGLSGSEALTGSAAVAAGAFARQAGLGNVLIPNLPAPLKPKVTPIAPPPAVPPLAAQSIRRGALWAGARVASRLVPYVGFALMLYELWDLLSEDTPSSSKKGYMPAGWSVNFDCPAAGGEDYNLARNDPNGLGCPAGGALLTITYGTWNAQTSGPFPRVTVFGTFPNRDFFVEWTGGKVDTFAGAFQTRFRSKYKFDESAGNLWKGVAPLPRSRTWITIPTRTWPAELPQLDPEVIPIRRPMPSPRPRPAVPTTVPANPFRVHRTIRGPIPNPVRPEVREVEWQIPLGGTDTTTTPRRPPAGAPPVGSQPKPATPPKGQVEPVPPPTKPKPVAQPEPRLGSPGRVTTKPEDRKRRPRERERKLKTGLPPGLIKTIFNAATEAHDVVRALYDAIPLKTYENGRWYRRPRAYSGTERALAVWENFERIDWNRAARNLLANQIEDFIFGKFGQLGNRAFDAAGRLAPSTRTSGKWDTFAGDNVTRQGDPAGAIADWMMEQLTP